jgi:hypothetical protein
MIKNEIDVTITDAMVTAAVTGLNATRTALITVLIASLTPDQRKSIFKMGKDSLQFVQEDYNYAQTPALKADQIDLTVWNNDITASAQLLKIMAVLEPLFNDVQDMLMLIGSEAMDAAQFNYRFLRYLAAQNQPTAQAAYAHLRELRWERPPHHQNAPNQ